MEPDVSPEMLAHLSTLNAWRTLSLDEQVESMVSRSGTPLPAIDPDVRDAVNACPHRGNELPVSAYRLEGCCAGPTRWTCSAGKGQVAGQPTLRFCLECLGGRT